MAGPWRQPSGERREDELPLQEGHDGPRAYAGLGAEVALSGNLGASRGDRLAPGCLQTGQGGLDVGAVLAAGLLPVSIAPAASRASRWRAMSAKVCNRVNLGPVHLRGELGQDPLTNLGVGHRGLLLWV